MSSSQVTELTRRIRVLSQEKPGPLVVAIDGRSGVGKTTLASELAQHFDATIISGDDFYVGGVRVRPDSPKVLVHECIDWKVARRVIQDLIDYGHARYHAFDWEKFDGSLQAEETLLRRRGVLIFEGVYSARQELRDMIDVSILVHVPEKERMNRLISREKEIGDWEKQWHRAEDWYFSNLVSPNDFDYVLEDDQLVEIGPR